MTNATLRLLPASTLIARLSQLEAVSRARPKDADRVTAEWRAAADELNARPMSEVLAAL
jgi:hypothetical protein